MWTRSRRVRDTVVRGLAKVSLVWAVALLGALFMGMSALGQHHDGGYSLDTSAHTHGLLATTDVPRTGGLALALLVLAGGITVLAIGALRGPRSGRRHQPGAGGHGV